MRAGSLCRRKQERGEKRVIAIRGPPQETEVPDYPRDTTSILGSPCIPALPPSNCQRNGGIVRKEKIINLGENAGMSETELPTVEKLEI